MNGARGLEKERRMSRTADGDSEGTGKVCVDSGRGGGGMWGDDWGEEAREGYAAVWLSFVAERAMGAAPAAIEKSH